MISRRITREEYVRLGRLAWFVITADGIVYYTNVR